MIHCFISGGISTVPDYLERFDAACKEVRSLGFVPVNPAAMSKPLLDDGVKFPNDAWLEIDFVALRQCNAVYHLDNWKNSTGAKREHAYALAYGLPIFYQENLELYKKLKENGTDLYHASLAGVDL